MHKTLKELTLLDRFLFDQTMDCPEAHEAALQIIFGDPNLRLLTPAQTEKELRTAPWLRSIRLDVYALDQDLSVYSTEMQKECRNDLVSRELRDFLHYIERTDDVSAEQTESERIRRIHSYVQKIRTSEEMGVKYMQAWEEKALERLAGKEEGKAEGKAESVLELLEELGPVPEELRKKIMDEREMNTLKGWLKLAAKVSSVEDFCFLLDSKEKI